MRAFIYTGGVVHREGVTERPEEGDLIIAADSGYRTAEAFGVTPRILLGDFDSLGEPNPPKDCEVIRMPVEKDETDTQLAVSCAIDRGAKEIVIIGGLEGRLDHTLSTVAILEDLYTRRCPAILTNGKNRVRFVRNSGVILPRSQYRFFSVIAADPVIKGVTIEGGKYPLKKSKLWRTHQLAVSNEITGNCALIEIAKGGAWIVESMD